MGYYDEPAMLKTIFEATGKKAVVMGYSVGTALAIYGMATRQDEWAKYTERFIGYAPCLVSELVELGTPYHADPFPTVAYRYKEEFDQGNLITSDSLTGGRFTKPTIDCSKSKDKDCEYEYGTGLALEMHGA